MMLNRFRFGFTMAEIMIAVVIIGIIATATVPNLVRSYNEKSHRLKLNKMHHDLEQNLTYLKADNIYAKTLENTAIGQNKNANSIKTFFNSYYKVKSDNFNTIKNTYVAADNEYLKNDCTYGVLLKDDSIICFNTSEEDYNAVVVYIDTNGFEPPNMQDQDIYTFRICNDFSIDVSCINNRSTKEANLQARQTDRENIANGNSIYKYFAKYLLETTNN